MRNSDSDSESIDDLTKDPTFKCKTTVEVTDRSTRQTGQTGSTGSNLAKIATKAIATQAAKASSGKASVAKVVTVSSLANMPGEDDATREVLVELKDIFKDVSSQNKKDNVLTLNDLPYFGINPADDTKKWIIPLEECDLFLETIEKQTEDVDFSDLGRIRVLKTHLLGRAQNYWKGFAGNTWDLAKAFLLERYPDINDYDSYMEKVRALKRNPAEQL